MVTLGFPWPQLPFRSPRHSQHCTLFGSTHTDAGHRAPKLGRPEKLNERVPHSPGSLTLKLIPIKTGINKDSHPDLSVPSSARLASWYLYSQPLSSSLSLLDLWRYSDASTEQARDAAVQTLRGRSKPCFLDAATVALKFNCFKITWRP